MSEPLKVKIKGKPPDLSPDLAENLKQAEEILVSRGKFEPWWNRDFQNKSKSLWIPDKEYKTNEYMKQSWFNITKSNFTPQEKLTFKIEAKSEPPKMLPHKTLKIRVFPTDEEKVKFHQSLEMFKWFYNYSVEIFNQLPDKHLSGTKLRDEIKQWSFKSEERGNLIFEFAERTGLGKFPELPWMTHYHSRIPRGAIIQLYQNFTSAYSNFVRRNIETFHMKYKRKRNLKDECLFEDSQYPTCIKYMKGTCKQGKKRKSFNDILNKYSAKGGLTLIFDKRTNRYFVHLPVELSKFGQEVIVEKQDIISLDTGVRTFQTGYSPDGHILEIGKDAYKKLAGFLEKIDELDLNFNITKDERYRKKKLKLYTKIENLVDDLHWKTISMLLNNYKTILLPDFRISGMVKRKNISKMTKRLLYMFSFYKFRERLLWKASFTKTEVKIVDESWTSKTCGCCGWINYNLGSDKTFSCDKCKIVIDRDVNGARNILLKHL